MLASSFPPWISMWGSQELRAGVHIHVLTAWLLMSFYVFVFHCWAVFIEFTPSLPIPLGMVSLLASSDFQCDSVWWYSQVIVDHEGTQIAFTGCTIPRRDVFFVGS